MYVKVVLKESTIEFDKEYTYSVPVEFQNYDLKGARVKVLFGKSNKLVEGYIISVSDDEESPFYVKPIVSVDLPCPVLREDQLVLVQSICRKYSCTRGDAIRLMVPSTATSQGKTTRTVFLTDPLQAAVMVDEGEFHQINQVRVTEYLLEYGESLVSDVLIACAITDSTLRTMAKKQIVNFGKAKISDNSDISNEAQAAELQQPFVANEEQEYAINEILKNPEGVYNEFLLHGITGSGKTEVYMQVLKSYLDIDKGAILLVPEISLTPQMIFRLTNRFGEDVRVLHSRMTNKERNEQWRDILSGKAKIVVGARSAVFAPVKNLGIIIIDEEQETSYKSETHPKYNAAAIAQIRMQHLKGILICGSATPKVETYYRSKTGQTRLLHLSKRATGCFLPKTQIVDLREELANGNKSIFSNALRQKMLEAFAHKEQVILFINRRGYSGFYLCRDCGYVPKCESCSVSLTYHLANKALICHYCGKMYPLPKSCPTCKSDRIGGFGAGTQKIEEICRNEFPESIILRMDQDTTTGRGSHARILEQFEKGEADILIGTQMIAKGHDFPNVTVVGILSADLILGMPDFRASERTFQLITQAAGRAGRGVKEGNVIIQAYNVDEYSIVHAAAQDYEGFYEQEIAFRKAMGYPPFGAIGIIIVSSEYESAAHNAARKIRAELSECSKNNCDYSPVNEKIDIMEISKAPIHMIRNRYRYRIVLKASTEEHLSSYFSRAQMIQHEKGVMISFDINPYQMF